MQYFATDRTGTPRAGTTLSGAETIVVGAGSSGCVLAARLSEGSDRSVLLIEAGPDYPPGRGLPIDLEDARVASVTRHDWRIQHRTRAGGLDLPLPRGRVVGGSSAVNTCVALRGQPEDYDEWAALGLDEWSFEQCLPAFKKLERDLDFSDSWHGTSGPLPLRRHPESEWVPWQRAFVEACRAHGFSECADTNRPGSSGVGPHAMNKLDGRRISAAEAYLTREVRARENLVISPDTLVRRVIFRGRRAVGVEIQRQGRIERVSAKRVVLAAGALHTPPILLRSGIGPERDVRRLGAVPLLEAKAVGRKLLDHPGFAMFLLPKRSSGSSRHHPLLQTCLRFPSREYNAHPTDLLLQPGSTVGIPYVRLPLVSIMGMVGKPRGHGLVRWHSKKIDAVPRVDSRLLEEPDDLSRAIDAMYLAFELAQSSPMRKLASMLWPRPSVFRHRDDIERWIAGACDSGYHASGTVPMGIAPSSEAAVDPHGRVFGVENLFVADASVMPTIPSSNIHLATLMIAERIAEWLCYED